MLRTFLSFKHISKTRRKRPTNSAMPTRMITAYQRTSLVSRQVPKCRDTELTAADELVNHPEKVTVRCLASASNLDGCIADGA